MTYRSRVTPADLEVPLEPVTVRVEFYAETHCKELTDRPARWLVTGITFVRNATLYEPITNFTLDGQPFRPNVDYVTFDWQRQDGLFTKWTAGRTVEFQVRRDPVWQNETESNQAQWLPNWNRYFGSCAPYVIEKHVDDNPYFRLWTPRLPVPASSPVEAGGSVPGPGLALGLATILAQAWIRRR